MDERPVRGAPGLDSRPEASGDHRPPVVRIGHSARLDQAMAAIWAWFDDYGILKSLAADAVLARARRGELMLGTPRLLQLLVDDALSVTDATLVARSLAEGPWEPAQRAQIDEVLDAWWYESLNLDVGEHRTNQLGQRFIPAVALGILAQYSNHVAGPHSTPMIRWLDVWMAALDGPAAIHLATAIVATPEEQQWAVEAWHGQADARQQFLAWARSEPILNGLTLIGGTHITLHAVSDPEAPALGDVLDELL